MWVGCAPGMGFDACPKRYLMIVSSYSEKLVKRRCRSTVETLLVPRSTGKNNRGPWAAAQYAVPRLHQKLTKDCWRASWTVGQELGFGKHFTSNYKVSEFVFVLLAGLSVPFGGDFNQERL